MKVDDIPRTMASHLKATSDEDFLLMTFTATFNFLQVIREIDPKDPLNSFSTLFGCISLSNMTGGSDLPVGHFFEGTIDQHVDLTGFILWPERQPN